LIVLGAIVASSLASGVRPVAIASATLVIAIVTSWVFELYNGDVSGTYWQGRYSLPLLVGVPLVVGVGTERRSGGADRVAGWTALAVVNVAAWAAARRFGVGVDGSLAPWNWDTALQPITPVLVLSLHAAATAVLGLVLLERTTSVTSPPSRYRRVDDNASIRA
jgi:hypothetical protein